MAKTASTNVALRTAVMIGALVVLFLAALLPGPIGWLAGVGRTSETVRESLVNGPAVGGGDGGAVAAREGGGFSPVVAENSAPADDMPPVRRGEVGAAPAGSSGRGSVEERCRQFRNQLRELGAAYTRLESWESEPRIYRFHCTVSLSGAGAGSLSGAGAGSLSRGEEGVEAAYRTFEAASARPDEAMEKVLADVHAWLTPGRVAERPSARQEPRPPTERMR